MNLEGRKNNIYYDQTGKQILVGDLLKVYHFGKGNRTQYMYHVAVMEETKDFPVMALRCYTKDKPHYSVMLMRWQVCKAVIYLKFERWKCFMEID